MVRFKSCLLAFVFLGLSGILHAEEVAHAIDLTTQEQVFQRTAKLLHLEIVKPRPRVLDVSRLTPAERLTICAPGACGEHGQFAVNNYSAVSNVVLLTPDSRIDQLAHEFTHYFQVQYDTMAEGSEPEDEAVWVQNQFRK